MSEALFICTVMIIAAIGGAVWSIGSLLENIGRQLERIADALEKSK